MDNRLTNDNSSAISNVNINTDEIEIEFDLKIGGEGRIFLKKDGEFINPQGMPEEGLSITFEEFEVIYDWFKAQERIKKWITQKLQQNN